MRRTIITKPTISGKGETCRQDIFSAHIGDVNWNLDSFELDERARCLLRLYNVVHHKIREPGAYFAVDNSWPDDRQCYYNILQTVDGQSH